MILTDRAAFRAYIYEIFRKNGLEAFLDDARADAFCTLTEHMLTVNEKFNLTAIKDPERIVLLHYADCVKGASVFPEGARMIDVGCGAGFPSLPLAICRPDLQIFAMDSTAKRVNYVKDTAAMLGLSNVQTLAARAEDAGKNAAYRERFDCATARAVAALPVLCELCLPFVKTGGIFAAMKGKSAQEELTAAKRAIDTLGGGKATLHDTPLVDLDGEEFSHATIVISKEKATPKDYPRLYTKIAKMPL